MISTFNSEDEVIRKLIESFNFQRFGVPLGVADQQLKETLVSSILQEIGYCKNCESFSHKTFKCKTLGSHTSENDRCSDFVLAEEDGANAFNTMLGELGEFEGRENVPEPEAEHS